MACFYCGSQIDDLASFCTACGKPRGLVSVKTPSPVVCSSCGSSADPSSSFCTICGKPLQPAQTETGGGSISRQRLVEVLAPGPHCTFCRSSLDPGVAFCTFCGQPVAGSSSTSAAASPAAPASAPAVPVGPSASPTLSSSISAAPASDPPASEPAPTPQSEAQAYSPASSYPPPASGPARQPSGSVFRNLVLLLLLIIVACGFGGWYFWGVETVIVCSPPDVRVFLDDKELQPSSYGRYVVPHLSRQSHLLKVQRPGFADTIQKLDFPMTSAHEWVNITLISSKRPRR